MSDAPFYCSVTYRDEYGHLTTESWFDRVYALHEIGRLLEMLDMLYPEAIRIRVRTRVN